MLELNKPVSLSRNEARRIALAAQGMASSARPATTANWRRISAAIDRIHLLQIDSINVVARSHYLPVLARVGHYAPETLDARAFSRKKRRMFEYWAHEASLLPMHLHPLLRWRMARAADGRGIYKEMLKLAREQRQFIDTVRNEVRARGPVRASDLSDAGKSPKEWWSWSDGKTALEYLFATGEVTTAERRGNFERLYDIPERVIPPDVLNLETPDEPDAIRTLLDLSGRALGIATETDLRDYFRLPVAETKTALAQLVEDGRLHAADVDGWSKPAFLHVEAETPRRATGTSLLSPFDPLVWNRERAHRVFGFNYRIEIYTPAAKRVYGYYVLPFLMNGHMAARVCLKSDRQNDVLRVNASHLEAKQDRDHTAAKLAETLAALARWLRFDDIEVADAGNIAPDLKRAVDRI